MKFPQKPMLIVLFFFLLGLTGKMKQDLLDTLSAKTDTHRSNITQKKAAVKKKGVHRV